MRDLCCSCRGVKVNHTLWQQRGQTYLLGDWGTGESWEPVEALQCHSGSCLCGRGTSQFPFPASARSQFGVCYQGCYPVWVCIILVFCQGLPRKCHDLSSRTSLSVGPYWEPFLSWLLSWTSWDCKPMSHLPCGKQEQLCCGVSGTWLPEHGSARCCFNRQWDGWMCSVWNLMGLTSVCFVIFWERRYK